MMNFDALNWFESFIKKLKKALDVINHVTPMNLARLNKGQVSPSLCQKVSQPVGLLVSQPASSDQSVN